MNKNETKPIDTTETIISDDDCAMNEQNNHSEIKKQRNIDLDKFLLSQPKTNLPILPHISKNPTTNNKNKKNNHDDDDL